RRHIIRYPFIFRLRLLPKLRNCTDGSNDMRALSVSDWREVSDIVGDDIVGIATKRAMVERIILRIGREFSGRGVGYLFSVVADHIDESPHPIARDFETPQDLPILGQNLLAIEPGEDFRIVTPGQHEL